MIDQRISAWSPLNYHPVQARLWRTKSRRVCVAAGRGSGKSTVARRYLVRRSAERKPWPDPRYFYALPTTQRARRVAWEKLKELVPESWLRAPMLNDMIIRTHFADIYVVGLDRPELIEGDQWDGGIIDEAADTKPGWKKSVLPALQHRNGFLWLIGVTKRRGYGAKLFRESYFSDEWESFTWKSETILTPEQIRSAKREMALKDYREQYEASWETTGGQAYYAFDRDHNVRRCTYDATRPLIIGSDFNVNPMAWVQAQELSSDIGRRLEVVDELFMHDTNTQEALNALWSRYQHHKGGYWFYGDATGRARKTAASSSDYIQIHNDRRFKGAMVRYPKGNPPVKNRLAAVNALLCNAEGHRRLHIDPSCVNLIDDLENLPLDDTGHPDVRGDAQLGHITDALGYIVHAKYPVAAIAPEGVESTAVFMD